MLAAEGLFVLGYLLAADAPAGLLGLAQWGRWLRYQLRLVVAGLIAAGAVLGALDLHQADSAWLTVAWPCRRGGRLPDRAAVSAPRLRHRYRVRPRPGPP